MEPTHPNVIVLAGPNGAGKSTAAPALLRGALRVTDFVNADVIARGLSAFNPESVALKAGEIMLRRLRTLAATRAGFAFETTLASRTFAPWLRDLIAEGYTFHLLFLWLPTAEGAIARVAERVRMGGHAVPEETVRRRHRLGLRNFFELYQPLTTSWRIYNNFQVAKPRLIAAGSGIRATRISDARSWERIRRSLHE